jgi:hypothetical protein
MLDVDGVPVFVKRIPLTDREVRSSAFHRESVRPAGILPVRHR